MNLSEYDNQRYASQVPRIKFALWFAASRLIFMSSWFPFYGLKAAVLRWFGASVGKNLVIKPSVNIKYPWLLSIGSNVWIGEGVWLENLDLITIEDNVCISQGAFLCSGNHDWNDPAFKLLTKPIHLEEGSWIAAKCVVGPGVKAGRGAVLCLGSVAARSLEAMTIYAGNPARPIKKREFRRGN